MPGRKSSNHRRIRKDHANETAEDYVEAIQKISEKRGKCRITDLASAFQVSHVTVIKTVGRLKEKGLAVSEPYGPIELTTLGRRLATKSRREHEVVFHFLCAIGVSEKAAKVDAEGIEHHASRETLECFRRVTGQLNNARAKTRRSTAA